MKRWATDMLTGGLCSRDSLRRAQVRRQAASSAVEWPMTSMEDPAAREERGQRFAWRLARRLSHAQMARLGSVPPLLAQILYNRGYRDLADIERFLRAEEAPLGDPWAMADLPAAVERIGRALDRCEPIAVYGDYDADGLTATAVLCLTLRALGAAARPFVPHREREGYGLRDGALDALRDDGAGLVITVDCGVTAVEEVARARRRGLDVVITDHHEPPAALPPAPVLNPRRSDCAYPFKDLAGVGVAYRLAEALLRARLPASRAEETAERLLDLVAVGTLADVVPLHGENRGLVRRGLEQLRREGRPGVRALLARAGARQALIDADTVTFTLVPRLNAAGRLADPAIALEVLLAEDEQVAAVLAERVDALNRRRQVLMGESLARARAEALAQMAAPVVVLAGDYPLGLCGLLAGRLAEELGVPAVVLQREGDLLRGSARSVPGLDIHAALTSACSLLRRFGGHRQAAGLELSARQLAPLREALTAAVAAQAATASAGAQLFVDAELRASTVTRWETLEVLRQLEPLGSGNTPPLFLTRRARVVEWRPLGSDRIRLRLAGLDGVFRAAAGAEVAGSLRPGDPLDVVYRLRRRTWRDNVHAEAEIIDWRPASLGGTGEDSN